LLLLLLRCGRRRGDGSPAASACSGSPWGVLGGYGWLGRGRSAFFDHRFRDRCEVVVEEVIWWPSLRELVHGIYVRLRVLGRTVRYRRRERWKRKLTYSSVACTCCATGSGGTGGVGAYRDASMARFARVSIYTWARANKAEEGAEKWRVRTRGETWRVCKGGTLVSRKS